MSENLDEPSRGIEHELQQISDPLQRIQLIEEWLCPPEPQLLDSCIVQNLDWVDRQLEERGGTVTWTPELVNGLRSRFGHDLADDLLDLGTLYKCFEFRGGYPWVVSDFSDRELAENRGRSASGALSMHAFLKGHQDCMDQSFAPDVPIAQLTSGKRRRVSPLILRGLGVQDAEEVYSPDGPIGFLRDEGDRQVAGTALFANIPAILTTDRRSLWIHRERLADFGLDVVRPSELLPLYEAYWSVMDLEYARRRGNAPD